jgi:hypothetical protein
VHGLSRFAALPKRLGAVSAAMRARRTILPGARQRLAGRIAGAVGGRVYARRKIASINPSSGELIYLECGSPAAASWLATALQNFAKQGISTMSSRNKPNGHGAMLARSSGANAGTISSSGAGAASVDASDLSVANAGASSATAGAEREAYADVAPVEGEGRQPQTCTSIAC